MTSKVSTETFITNTTDGVITTNAVTSERPDRTRKSRLARCLTSLPPWKGALTVVACTFMEATLGVAYTSGNLMPYLTSYMRNVTGETWVDYGQMLWIYNSMWLVVSATIAFMGLVERRIPNKLFVLIGILFNAAAFFGTYWAVQESLVALVIVYGILQGVAASILYPNAVNLALKWFPHRKGLVAGLTMGGYGGGAFIWNQVVTKWINPDNLQPDLIMGENRYFTQAELLSRVPTCFLVLGGILISVQLVCLVTATSPTPGIPCHPKDQEGTLNTENHAPHSHIVLKHIPDPVLVNSIPGTYTSDSAFVTSTSGKYRGLTLDSEIVDVSMNRVKERKRGGGDTAGCQKNGRESLDPDDGTLPHCQDHRDVSLVTENQVVKIPQYGPLTILKSRMTWTLWLNNLNLDYAFLIIVAFYKAYGQTFIHNDHLLALVGSFAAVFNSVGRPIWGIVADRIGYFPAMLLTQGTLLVTSATFVTCEMAGSSAMFMVWVCGMFTAFSGIYSLQSPVLFTLFGPNNFIFVLGVITSTGILSTLTSVIIAEGMLAVFGWKGMFILAACFVLCSMLILCSLLLSCGYPIPPDMRTGLRIPGIPQHTYTPSEGTQWPSGPSTHVPTEED